jgi:Flp pilus assembly pilin Flp
MFSSLKSVLSMIKWERGAQAIEMAVIMAPAAILVALAVLAYLARAQ